VARRFIGSILIASPNNLRNKIHLGASRDSSVGIATGCTSGVRFSAGERDYLILHSVQTGFETHTFCYPVCTGDKAAGA
jgi:hypothetical protein